MKASLKLLKRRIFQLVVGVSLILAIALIWGDKNAAVETAHGDVSFLIPLPVIMYHSVVKDPLQAGAWVITTEAFEEDLEYLKKSGYTTVTAKEVLDYLEGTGDLPEKPVMITFDDGYYNNMIYAKPILKRYHMHAIVSPIGYKMDEFSHSDDRNPSYAYLSWEDLCKLQEDDVFEIGNHSYDLHRKDKARIGVTRKKGESEETYRAVLMEDIGKLQQEIQAHCGVTPVTFAYPFGSYDQESEKILKEMGFQIFFTCYEKMNYIERASASSVRLGRYNRAAGESTLAFMKRALKQ